MLGPRCARAPASCKRPPARYTAIPMSIRRPRSTAVTLIWRARAAVTTKANAAPRRCSTITSASTGSPSGWRASSSPTGPTYPQARRFQLHHPGAEQPADHHLWLVADEIVLLCRRSGRRPHASDECSRATSTDRSTSAIPFETAISELAELIISSLARARGSSSVRRHRTTPDSALLRHHPRQTDPALMPAVPPKEGLSRTIRYFDSLLSSPNKAKKIVWKVAS